MGGAEGTGAAGVGQLSGGRALLGPLAHYPMALRNKQGAQSRTYRTQRANPPSEFARLHGALC